MSAIKIIFFLTVAMAFLPVASAQAITFDFTDTSSDICLGGYHKDVSIFVSNTGVQTEKIILFSDSGLFFPQFDNPELTLAPGQRTRTEFKINFNDFTRAGEYSVPVFAKTVAGTVFSDSFDFKLVECTDGDPFELLVSDSQLTLGKFEIERVRVTVKNNLDRVQDISFNALSELPSRPGQYHFSLGPFESQDSFVEIEARQNDKAETHFVDLVASSEFGKQTKSIKVAVRKNHDILFNLLQNELTSVVCSATEAAVFEIELTNSGDEKETVNISVDNDFDDISATVSDERIELKENEKKTVRVIVNPSFDSELGEKEIALEIRGQGFAYRENIPLRFTVVGSGSVLQKVPLKVLSAPLEVNAVTGEQKVLNVKIGNPTELIATNITVRVRGTDRSQVEFSEEHLLELAAGEITSVDIKMNSKSTAKNRVYDLTIEVFSENSFAFAPFTLNLKSQPIETKKTVEKGIIPALMGFFNISGPMGGGILFLTIILIIAVGIILLFLLISSNNNKAGFNLPVH